MIINYAVQYDAEIVPLIEHYPMEWGESVPTVLALEHGEVVGVGSLSTNDYHPYREYVKIFVQPKKRERGIGRSIFEMLQEQSKQKKFQAAISSKDKAGVSFLEQSGFKLVRKCYTPVLKNENSFITTHYPTLQELSDEIKNEVFALQFENYHTFHEAINPLNERISFHQWKELVSDGLAWEQSYVLLKDEKVAAYVLCYAGEAPGQIEIGYVGGNDMAALEEYTMFFKQVVDQFIQDFDVVEIEADDVDPYAFALLNQYAYDQTDSWETYIWDRK